MKKFISLLVVFTMLLTMFAALNVTTAYAASTTLYEWGYFNSSNSQYHTAYNGTTYSGKYFQISSSDNTRNVTLKPADSISDEPYLNIISDKYIWSNNSKVDTSKPVLDFSFKMYIPTADLKSNRYLYLVLAKKDASGKYENGTYGTVYFTLTDSSGKVYGGANANTTNVYRSSATVDGDKWHQMNLRVFMNKEGQLMYGMYMDGVLYILCKSNAADISFDDIGIRQVYFNTTNNGANTYIKNMKLDLEDYDFAYNENESSKYLSSISFDNNKYDSSINLYTFNHSGIAKSTGGNMNLVPSTNTSNTSAQFYANGKFTNVVYTVGDVNVGDSGYMKDVLKLDLTPSATENNTKFTLIQNSRTILSTYFPSGETRTLQAAYDIMIPSGTEAVARQDMVFVGVDESTTNSGICQMSSKIQNKAITLELGTGYTNNDPGTRVTSDYTIESDKWYKVIELMYITNSSDKKYDYHMELYVQDIAADTVHKVEEIDGWLNKPTKAGAVPGLTVTQRRMLVTVPVDAEQRVVSTYLDNLTLRAADDFSPVEYKDVTVDNGDLKMICHNNGKVEAIGKTVAGSPKVILAGYDDNGKMVFKKISSAEDVNAETGDISTDGNYGTVNGISKIKAFMFDSIENCVPLAASCSLYVK